MPIRSSRRLLLDKMSLFTELRRRQVFKIAAAYLAVSWLVLQVLDTVSPLLGLSDAFGRGVLFLLLLGFPVALVFAWVFELTPEGIKIDRDGEPELSSSGNIGRNLNTITISVLSLAVLFFSLDKFVWSGSEAPESQTIGGQKRIAVLPFVNMSDDPEQAYFSDGLSEELLNLLAQIPELRVTSRTSAFSFKDQKNVTISEVGRALDVEHVLEGSVRRSGNTIRITAQLIDVSTDTHIWSDTWDRNFADVFVIQDEIAEFVVDALKIELFGNLPHAFETTPEAYELYLQAKFLIDHPSTLNVQQAASINQRVLDIDPDYVPAWTSRARIYHLGPGWGAWDAAESAPIAREAALKSLEMFESNAEAHAILARIAMNFDYDYETAGREIETALEMGTDNSFVFRSAAEFEQRQGNLERAIEYLDKAHEIDPISGRGVTGALAYFYAGRHDEGIAIWRENIAKSPSSGFLHKSLALSLLETGDVEGAFEEVEKENTEGHRLHGLAIIYQSIGDNEQSKNALEDLIANSHRWTWEVTEVYAHRGELDQAFEWMDRAIARNDSGLRHVMYSPYIDNMRDDPRFNEVLIRLGLKTD